MCSVFLAAEFKCGEGSYKADVLGLKRAIRGQAVVAASGLVQKTENRLEACGLILSCAGSTVVSTCCFSPE